MAESYAFFFPSLPLSGKIRAARRPCCRTPDFRSYFDFSKKKRNPVMELSPLRLLNVSEFGFYKREVVERCAGK